MAKINDPAYAAQRVVDIDAQLADLQTQTDALNDQRARYASEEKPKRTRKSATD